MDFVKLRKDIDKKLDNWNERNLFSIAGIKGLTRSDIDTLLMCCDWFEKYGTLAGLDYLGSKVRGVLDKYGGKDD